MGAAWFYPAFRDYLPNFLFQSMWLHLLIPSDPLPVDARLKTRAFNYDLSSPIGLSAGLDINGVSYTQLLRQGHSFVEIGPVVQSPEGFQHPAYEITENSVTLKASTSSYGVSYLRKRLYRNPSGPRGVNLFILKENLDSIPHMLDEDYLSLFLKLYHLSDFFTINLCSDSSKDLKIYQKPYKFKSLLSKLVDQRNFEMGLYAAYNSGLISFIDNYLRRIYMPIYVKIDCDWQDTEELVKTCLELGVDGLIVGDSADDSTRSQEILRKVVRQSQGKLEIISFGGLWNGREVLERVKIGAKAVQVFSVLLGRGPWELRRLQEELLQALKDQNFESIDSAFNFYSKDKND